MSELPPQSLEKLLANWSAGNPKVLESVLPMVYNELHRLAHSYLRRERRDHTLQTTALINEAYLRLVQQGPFETQDRSDFLALAATLMRQILVDYARRRSAVKRGNDCQVTLNDEIDASKDHGLDVLALDDALTRLAKRDAQQGKIVELRFFAGLTVEETATVLSVSTATVKRDWSMARAWLSRRMKGREDADRAELEPN